MTLVNNKNNLKKRRLLRKNQTREEEMLWQVLRGNKMGMKWRRQISIGGYIADFYCYKEKIVIELDGIQHLREKDAAYDKIRDMYLKSNNIIVIRISNREIWGTETLSTIVERVVCEANRVRNLHNPTYI